MTRVTRSVPNQMFIWMNAPIRLRQGGRFLSFSQNICTRCKCFVKKIKTGPCCRRRFCRSPG